MDHSVLQPINEIGRSNGRQSMSHNHSCSSTASLNKDETGDEHENSYKNTRQKNTKWQQKKPNVEAPEAVMPCQELPELSLQTLCLRQMLPHQEAESLDL